jgi:hypothetical protein
MISLLSPLAPTIPTDVPDFVAICAAEGKIDMCCLLPIVGLLTLNTCDYPVLTKL